MPEDSGDAMTGDRRSRSCSVRAVGLLLLLQAVGYVAFSIILLVPFDWSTDTISPPQEEALLVGFVLIPSTIPIILSAIGFLFLARAGWLLAMAMQGATLLGCLALYLETKPLAIFPIMLYCIIMAFYLNSFDVRVAFYGGKAGHER